MLAEDRRKVARRVRERDVKNGIRRGYDLGDVEMLLSLVDEADAYIGTDPGLCLIVGKMKKVADRIRRA